MRKKILFTSIGIILLVIVYVATSIKKQNKPPYQYFNTTPTPITNLSQPINESLPSPSIVPISQAPLHIISVSPSDQSTNIPVKTTITINFTRAVRLNEITVTFGPSINYKPSISGSTLSIAPNVPLLPGQIYQYIIQFQDGTFSPKYSFTTAGDNPQANNPNYDNTSTLQNDWYKSYQPDVYLSNRTPYQGSDFSVTYDFTDIPNEHYYFIVTTTTDQGQQDFISWLHSIGLEDKQIQQLEIHYQ